MTGEMQASSSGDLDRNGAKEIPLADVDAIMTQDRVGGGDMEKEVRQQKVVEIVGTVHVALEGRTEGKRDLAIAGVVYFLRIDRFQIGRCFRQAVLQLIDCCLIVFVGGELDAGQP